MVPLTAQWSTFGATVRVSMWAETTEKKPSGRRRHGYTGACNMGSLGSFPPRHAKARKSYEVTSYVRNGPVTRQLCCRLFGWAVFLQCLFPLCDLVQSLTKKLNAVNMFALGRFEHG